MSRDPGLFLQDILDACEKIVQLVEGLDRDRFSEDWKVRDAVLHNLEVIGEAVKRLPGELKEKAPAIPWKRIAGFRDVLAHGYFSLDDAIVWDVARNETGPLFKEAKRLLGELDGQNDSSP
jgi:uncharacterized protein with HEPN domain